jgi:polar amino acid transport system permease protein
MGGFAYGATESFVITLSVYAGATMVEVFRAGLAAVPRGLIDAGKAIGLTGWQRLIWVRLPTMFRIVLPSLSNAFVSLFKDTSLASVIAVPELTYGAQWINTNSFRVIEVWSVVAPMYLVTGYALLFLLQRLERRFTVH